MTIDHPKIGKCELLFEAEMYYPQGNKFFALLSSKRRPHMDWRTRELTFTHTNISGKKNKIHHYILWGNSPDFELMGITHLVTPGYRPVRGSKPMRWFFECIRAAEFVEFIHKTK